MRVYEPVDFLSKLSANDLSNPTQVSIVGLAKSDKANPSSVHFSHSLACEQWVSMPIKLIEAIDHLRTVPCKDHQHPLVRIKFKRPDETHGDVIFLLNLVAHMQATLEHALKAARTGKRPAPSLRRADDFCFIWDSPEGLSVCCFSGDDLECTGMV
ncbi:hypothetical protein ACQPZ2_30540 [Nocardia pseudovaccinii]|uniref:hypothetical protein n=1 Tax=Nocardia pseudovaccinii TaxID=189540 RepID=UPI003D9133A7